MDKLDFCRDWEFYSEKSNTKTKLNLPHDATIGEDRDPEIRIGYLSGFYHGGNYVYTKKFTLKEEDIGKVIYLEFEGIYRDFVVLVNNTAVYSMSNGYTAFTIRIDAYLKLGDNEIKVEIHTPYNDHTRWYQGSGIYREAFIYKGEQSHIMPHGIRVTTLSHSPAQIRVQTEYTGKGQLTVEIFDGDKPVAKGYGADCTLEIPNAKLWSAASPTLYRAVVSLNKKHAPLDTATLFFGIRTLQWSAEKGFLVNGKRVLLRGGCIHQDNGVIGCVITRQTEERRIRKIKDCGFNAIRSAHHPASPALLEACDTYGIYVMDESFDSWYRMKMRNDFSSAFYNEYENVTRYMVQKDYNHPSVVMYSIGNEIPEMGSKKGIAFGKRMADIIRSIDKTRPVLASPSMRLVKDFLYDTPYSEIDEDEWLVTEERKKEDFMHYVKVWTRGLANILSVEDYSEERKRLDEVATKELYDYLDMAGYNYYGEYYEAMHEIHPDRVIVGTETEGNKVGFHYDLMQKHPYIIGDFVWTLQDHLGECNCAEQNYGEAQADKSYPWRTNWCGKLDLIGHENITAHRYRMVWGLEDGIVLAAQPPIFKGIVPTFSGDRETDAVMSWSFDGYEGENTYIDVVTTAPFAEVLINGKSLGKRKVENYATRFPAVYEKGEVKAVGYNEAGEILFTGSLVSAKSDTVLQVTPDRTDLTANGKDLCFIEIDVTDGNIIKSLPERKITVTVEGAGKLESFGSAAYKSDESYVTNEHTTFYGRVLAVLRSGNEPGNINVTVSCDGLEPITLQLKSR